MSIQILPPQLANQIAAGEVVERPASVVKELVENALDSGAHNIEIEIDKGGHKRILVRDTGRGIVKEELALALARHATSKIKDLDDLEAIDSLGFRGEALASISSVSRLTISSKPKAQEQAWCAIAEGLEMDVTVKPCAHPVGTSVEVVDLFFNTPGRRKFLRAEKTEFGHIETLIKRIALSRPDIGFVLKHNGKLVKRFRSQADKPDIIEQYSTRISEVVSPSFVEQASVVTNVYQNIKITIWCKQPEQCVSVNPAQYSFVNGRMMRDKLIQHAIRQAYGDMLHSEQLPEYVIYIELPANEVDVNVHPAKHEVRFHHSRLLHDLLVKSMTEALQSFYQQQDLVNEEPEWIVTSEPLVSENKVAASAQQEALAHQAYRESVTPLQETAEPEAQLKQSFSYQSHSFQGYRPKAPNAQQYDKLINVDEVIEQKPCSDNVEKVSTSSVDLLHVEDNRFAYLLYSGAMWIADVQSVNDSEPVDLKASQLTNTPLLVPVRMKLQPSELNWCDEHLEKLAGFGFEIRLFQSNLIVKQVPSILRATDSVNIVPEVLTQIMKLEDLQQITNVISQSKLQTQHQLSFEQMLTKLNQAEDIELELKKMATKLNPQQLVN